MNKKCYDNCKIFTEEGFFIGFCNKKKMEWYLKMNLANVETESSIKLNFKPNIKGKKTEIDSFRDVSTKSERKNVCIACNSTENISVHSLVPVELKKHYTIDLKSHRSDLMVALCTECKVDAQYFDSVLLEEVLKEYGFTKKDLIDPVKMRLKTAAQRVKKNKFIKECDKEIIVEHIGESGLADPKKIDELTKMDIWKLIDGITIYNYIVNKIIADGDLVKFENKCIKHFYENMDPSDMPPDVVDRIEIHKVEK
jgi:hypothetical protein